MADSQHSISAPSATLASHSSRDRRGFLAAGAATIVAVSAFAPAIASAAVTQDDPVTAYWKVHAAYNAGGPVTEAEYLAAHRKMRAWTPTTERDFIRQFVARFDDGNWAAEKPLSELVAEASRLMGEM